MNLRPVTLTGKRVRLEPLGTEHAEDLAVAATDDQIWTYLDEPTPWDRSSVDAFIADANRDQERGARIAFAIVDTAIDRAVGSTSYIDIRSDDRGVEIGWTWITPSAWGTGINTEAKYLMLAHAFDDQCAIRVAIKTDQRNVRSQRAIERLGAVREGVWRNHRILTTGEYRHTVYYSIIETDWNNVKELLKTRMQ
jgi:RimJ/RimL family protein N-acetyltransferase